MSENKLIEMMAGALGGYCSVLRHEGHEGHNGAADQISGLLAAYAEWQKTHVTISREDYALLMVGAVPSHPVKIYNTAGGVEQSHPDDKLSQEAGIAMSVEVEGKYTRVITERLEDYISRNIKTAMEVHGANCSNDVFDGAVKAWIVKLKGDDDEDKAEN